jgi:hypothetical protein
VTLEYRRTGLAQLAAVLHQTLLDGIVVAELRPAEALGIA